MSKEIVFELNQVGFTVNDIKILRSVTLRVSQGDFLVILGASGAGKSSLLRMFNVLTSPTEGTINFRGKPCDLDIPTLRSEVGILFQNPTAFPGTVKDNLMIAGQWKHSISQLLDHELLEALAQVGLNTIGLNHKAKDLSGGEQQRLALAITLLNKPSVLLLDEPTSSLDPKLSRSILDLIDNLRKKLDLTIIAASHDHDLVKNYATNVILLSKGEILAEGSFAALEQNEAYKSALLAEEPRHET